jgi:hypothetical protein
MYGLAKVIEWNGEEGLLEDEQGDILRFSYEDIHPRDLDYVAIGVTVLITEQGYLELTSSGFSHYLESETDELACFHENYKDGVCNDCGEQVDWVLKKPS